MKTFFVIYVGYCHIFLRYGKLINTTATKTEKEVQSKLNIFYNPEIPGLENCPGCRDCNPYSHGVTVCHLNFLARPEPKNNEAKTTVIDTTRQLIRKLVSLGSRSSYRSGLRSEGRNSSQRQALDCSTSVTPRHITTGLPVRIGLQHTALALNAIGMVGILHFTAKATVSVSRQLEITRNVDQCPT